MTLHLGETIHDVDHLSTTATTRFWHGDVESELRPVAGRGRWALYTDGVKRATLQRLLHGYEAHSLDGNELIVDPNWRTLVVRIIEGELG